MRYHLRWLHNRTGTPNHPEALTTAMFAPPIWTSIPSQAVSSRSVTSGNVHSAGQARADSHLAKIAKTDVRHQARGGRRSARGARSCRSGRRFRGGARPKPYPLLVPVPSEPSISWLSASVVMPDVSAKVRGYLLKPFQGLWVSCEAKNACEAAVLAAGFTRTCCCKSRRANEGQRGCR